MRRAYRRWRCAIALGLVSWSACAFALNPALDLSQYAHTAWKIRDGFTKGSIFSIAQTPDGYLWLGTDFGLTRFDGVRNVPWQPPRDQTLPSSRISRLLAARDGTLWIGTRKGLASWKSGKLTHYAELAGQLVMALVEDREGSVWAGGLAVPSGRLCAIRKGRVQCYGEDGALGIGVLGMYEDGKGNLWAGGQNGLWRWKPGPPRFYPLQGETAGIAGLAEGDDGALLIGARGGVKRLVDGKTEVAYPLPGSVRRFPVVNLLRDREGGLWAGTEGGGLVHAHQGRTDVFAQSDGLSGDQIQALFEDREGNVWVATTDGLDRFRDFAVATFSANQGLSNVDVGAVLAAKDGSVWLSTLNGLARWNLARITVYRGSSNGFPRAARQGLVREIAGSGLPNRGESLFQDDRGRIWVSTVGGVGYMENDSYIPIGGVPGGEVYSIAEDAQGDLWIANQDRGLLHLRGGTAVEPIPWANLGRKDYALALAADRLHGGLWLGFSGGGITYFADGQVRASYTSANGLGQGVVSDLRLDRDGTLWAATEGGLSRLKNGRVATLNSKNGLPCDVVHWVMEDNAHSHWLNTACGLLRIARPELDAWAADPSHSVKAAVFDSADGVRSIATAGAYTPHANKSPDGKLWFTTADGVSVVDPSHLSFNKLPPPMQIEQVIADRKTYAAGAKLPPLVRDVEIDYTALSLVAPEKMRFRYKLEGRDRDWHEAGNRRQAFYDGLSPRNYRFRVMAANNDGVWNEAGASFDFSVAPAYYQTTWFLALVVAAVLAVLTGLHRLRLLYLTKQFNARMEGRVSERTRVARDLHDTLLQSFQGTLLKFHSVSYMLPNNPEAQKSLESCIEQARAAIAEGRDAVQGLRSSTMVVNDLARAVTTFGGGLVADQPEQTCPEFRVQVEGKSKDLPPLVRDEVYRIACESLRNAFRHAQAKRIEVEFCYDSRQFRLRVVDNGKGIDPTVLSAGGRAGHHGLPGLNERAQMAGGKLSVWSQLNSGTEIELTIPAAIAYLKSSSASRSASAGKENG